MVEIGDLRVPVISAEDLITTKILAGRPKDLQDVESVLRERLDALDLSIIRSTLWLLEQALARNDLQPVFETTVARIRTSIDR